MRERGSTTERRQSCSRDLEEGTERRGWIEVKEGERAAVKCQHQQ